MIIEESVMIKAPRERVWETFIDLTCWADWNTVLEEVSGEMGRMQAGGSFRCCLRPYSFGVYIEPRIESVEPMERIVWTSRKYGVSSYHEYFFREGPEGVEVLSRERLTGLPLILGGLLFPKSKVLEMNAAFLRDLKEHSEHPERRGGESHGEPDQARHKQLSSR